MRGQAKIHNNQFILADFVLVFHVLKHWY